MLLVHETCSLFEFEVLLSSRLKQYEYMRASMSPSLWRKVRSTVTVEPSGTLISHQSLLSPSTTRPVRVWPPARVTASPQLSFGSWLSSVQPVPPPQPLQGGMQEFTASVRIRFLTVGWK